MQTVRPTALLSATVRQRHTPRDQLSNRQYRDGDQAYEIVEIHPLVETVEVAKTADPNAKGVDLIFTIVSITYRHTIAGM